MRLEMRIVAAACLIVLGAGASSAVTLVPSSVLAQTDPATRVDACMISEMASRNIHGAGIAIAVDGEMVFERAYGRKHRDRENLVDIHTQFRIGSTTKSLTALALMQQVDAGTIDLDAPITTYLDDLEFAEPGQAARITVRDLLRHTSGLHDTSAMDESDLFGPTDDGAMRRWVAEQVGTAPYAPPARFWNYSSANYMYAGQILERVAGMSYPDYMDDNVFAPAGMVDTTQHAAEGVERGNFAYGHFSNPFSGKLEIYDLDDNDNWARHPTGYANSTAGDLVRFANLMLANGGEVLSEASAIEMQTRQTHRDLRVDQYYGLGTFVEFNRGREMIHHDGGAWGWSATMKWIPSAGLAVATVTNVVGLMTSSTQCAIEAYTSAVPTVTPPCRMNRADWSANIGTYQGSVNSGAEWVFEITRPAPTGDLVYHVEREGSTTVEGTLTQNCGLWQGSGPGTFNGTGSIGQITFIEDPVELGVKYIRHRFYAARREAPGTPEPTAAPTREPTPRPTPDLEPVIFLPKAMR